MRAQYPDPEDMVALAEAIALAETELEAATRRETTERHMRRAREIVDCGLAEGQSLETIAFSISAQIGVPARDLIALAERTVAEVKALLSSGMERPTVMERLAERLPEGTHDELARVVDACAADLAG